MVEIFLMHQTIGTDAKILYWMAADHQLGLNRSDQWPQKPTQAGENVGILRSNDLAFARSPWRKRRRATPVTREPDDLGSRLDRETYTQFCLRF